MKKLFSFLAVAFALLSFSAKAQSTSIKIINNSSCQVCFILEGATGPRCLPIVAKSKVICVPAGGTVTFASTNVAPFSPPLTGGLFVGLCWFNHDPSACPDVPLDSRCIVDKCAGSPQTDKLLLYNADCKECATVTGTWTSSGTMATVVFM